ncbi:DNA-3-methyladenine glycosylase 1-like [Achroia grisella]|uniref:DNA-3-methyladenine glycosylase 1-like n=1 Tax=Achroia grisella TaxID=688607 RepID=UPI0027D20DC9|nr:DNA-3-methyladenine glycosylase 1-like [Achroia grisella]XP_059047461.1 DNA-3-methyladenine glycosylase 1-like [Achroia grisella]
MSENESKVIRCQWLTKDPIYIAYHDDEWGKPEYDSLRLFEMLCLEGQQAGLSWITILKKRENYRKVFHHFNPYKVAKLNHIDVKKILSNTGIVRHKGKIEAIINNAKCYTEMENNSENFSKFIWSFVNNKPIVNDWCNIKDIPNSNAISSALSIALKKRGFKFVGSTICYAFMQACGLVNDHVLDCICRETNNR